jgi:hypothetical protein
LWYYQALPVWKDQVSNEPKRLLTDRRSAIKKAAVAGALVWTAPVVLSSKAAAIDFIPGTTCTLKCLPNPNVSINANTQLYCTGAGRKWAQINFTVNQTVCPCGGGGSSVAYGGLVSPNPADIKEISYDPGTNTGFVRVGGMGSGALGDGNYALRILYCVQCFDRDGDTLSRLCQVDVAFTFHPGDGNCSLPGNVGDASLLNQTCTASVCDVCPTPNF